MIAIRSPAMPKYVIRPCLRSISAIHPWRPSMRSWRLASGALPVAAVVLAVVGAGLVPLPVFGTSLVFALEAVAFLAPAPPERPGSENLGMRMRGARNSGIGG